MALPPEPLDEILPQANCGVIAEVKQIIHRDEQTSIPDTSDPEVVDTPRDLPAQVALLTVKSTLFGNAPEGDVEVLKPAGDYVLREGVQGPFLLATNDDNRPTILGRYGPDTYTERALQAAIKSHGL